jgi:hypothetical protein
MGRTSVQGRGRDGLESALCSRWLTTWRMGEDAPSRPSSEMSDFRAPWLGSGPAENHPKLKSPVVSGKLSSTASSGLARDNRVYRAEGHKVLSDRRGRNLSDVDAP